MTAFDTDSEQIASYWDKHVGQHLGSFEHWEANVPVMLHQNTIVTGDANVTPLEWFWRKYGPFQSIASTGSGTGILEAALCTFANFEGSITGYDISPASLEIARNNCSQYSNVNFEVADLNTKPWQRESFDAVMAHGSLHHIANLKWCLSQMAIALKPEGLLYVNDYVGPRRFQWSDLQIKLANEMLASVPDQWKQRSVVSKCDPELLQQQDPSEAVRSDLIRQTVNAYFHVIEIIHRGGTLLAPIFGSGCLNSSILDSASGLQCLADLAEQETQLIRQGIIPADNVIIVAKKKSLSISNMILNFEQIFKAVSCRFIS
jgi:ubiquinone/menaquinone biosynthesis C-methylase UbiE